MPKIKLIHADATAQTIKAEMIVTDPPFDLRGEELYNIIKNYDAEHLLLICSMRQLISFAQVTDFKMGFDFVLDLVAPKQSKSLHQPNYIHAHVVYFYKHKTAFNRKNGERTDVFTKGYCPTIVRASRERNDESGYAKNQQALTDILSFFKIDSVVDMFAGSGTTGLACNELGIQCTLIEKDLQTFEKMRQKFKFLGLVR